MCYMHLPNNYSEDMPDDEKNIEIMKEQMHMFYDYRFTFLLQKSCYI